MPFIQPQQKILTGSSPFDGNAAKFLAKSLLEQRLIKGMPSIANWSEEFRLLRHHSTESEIKQTLIWFCKHVKDKYTPKVYSASGFRSKFVQIKNAMARGSEDWNILPDIEITDQARRISVYLGGLVWPGDIEVEDELKAIQVSINNYNEFLTKLRAVSDRHPQHARVFAYMLVIGRDVSTFVEGWFRQIHSMAWGMENWGKNLARATISMQSPRFQRIIDGWIRDYRGGNENHWEWLERILK